MSGDSTDGTSTDATKDAPKDDASKDANAKGDANQDGKAGDAKDSKDGKEGDPTAGLKKALAAERKLREGLEKEKRDAELSKLPELERAKAQVDELSKENEKLTKENMRMKIAMDMGLTWGLAKRLSGDTEDEMRSDAADLLKDYKPAEKQIVADKEDPKNQRPKNNDAKKAGGSGGPTMNDLLRAAAGRRAS